MISKITFINTNNTVLKKLLIDTLEQITVTSGVLNGAALTNSTTLNYYSIRRVLEYPIFEIAAWSKQEKSELKRIVKLILRDRIENILRKIDEFNFEANNSKNLTPLEKFKINSESQRWKHRVEKLINEILSGKLNMYGVITER